MRLSRNLVSVFMIFSIELNLAIPSEISLYECPSEETPRATGKVKFPDHNVWTTLLYGESAENVTNAKQIRLEQSNLNCVGKAPDERIVINFIDQYNKEGLNGWLIGRSEQANQDINLSINDQGSVTIFYSDKEQQFNRNSYCIRRLNTTHSSMEICCGKESSCLRKCCPYGYDFHPLDQCTPRTSSEWNLQRILSTESQTTKTQIQHLLSSKKIRTGFPDCQASPYNITTYLSTALTKFHLPRQPFRLFEDGTLKFLIGGRSKSKWKTKAETIDYCVDTVVIDNENLDLTCGEYEQDVLILCSRAHVKAISKTDWTYRIVYMVGFVVSILFLLTTAVVHFLLWEKQNIHAWTILLYVLTLTGFYSCLLVIYIEETRKRWAENYVPFLSKESCFALGIVTHFMGIFSFSWLSVINFDLWWTFRVLKPMNQRGFDVKRLLFYTLFAVAVPTVVVSTAGMLQVNYDKQSEVCRSTEDDPTIYPSYGEDGCFLANSSQPYYFYLPVGVLLLVNLIFYLFTSCQMLRIYNVTSQISNRNPKKQKQSCELFLKLFLVMGITWIFQVIFSLVENDEPKWYSPIFVVLDLVNMFQAVAIFLIFVCKRETLRALEQKYICLKSCLFPFRGAYRPTTIISRSTDGSTRMSRAELTKHGSIDSTGSDHRRDSELINFS